MRQFCFSLLILLLLQAPAEADKKRIMMLAGGYLPVCSSVNLDACDAAQRGRLEQEFKQNEARLSPIFMLDETRLKLLSDSQYWPPADRESLPLLVQTLRGRLQQPLSRDDLRELGKALSEEGYSLLLDVVEAPQVRRDGKAKREQVVLEYSDPHVQIIWQAVVKLARNQNSQTPRIGIITTASHDALGGVDYLAQTIKQAGGEPVWIALEPRWYLLDENDLDDSKIEQHRRLQTGAFLRGAQQPHRQQEQLQQLTEPEQWIKQIATLDGLFFGGGDQSLLRRSLYFPDGRPTTLLHAVQQRWRAGELVIAGTSAGTAVQSGDPGNGVPMIANGDSEQAFSMIERAGEPQLPFCFLRADCVSSWQPERLSYQPAGGLNLFKHGVLDTHFSQRARQARLMRVLQLTDSKRGFGVDETTALLMFENDKETEFAVIGKHGVWLVEQLGPQRFISHYLNRHDRARLTNKGLMQIELGECAVPVADDRQPVDAKTILGSNGVHRAALHVSEKSPLDVCVGEQTWRFGQAPDFQACKRPDALVYRQLQIDVLPASSE